MPHPEMPSKAVVGIIGGSGLYESGLFKTVEAHKVSTPWGAPSGMVEEGNIGDTKTFFIPRHAQGHTIPAHKVNYRANIDALKTLGVNAILTVNSVGSLKEELPPGTFVLPDQFVDFTKNRASTFYDGGRTYHVSTADPFCPTLADTTLNAARRSTSRIATKKTYVCIEGPRFSTRAESRFFRTFSDIIGMTLCPEAQLAREREMCYLPICMVTDYDAWDKRPVEATDVFQTLSRNVKRVRDLLRSVAPMVPPPSERNCACLHALELAAL